MKSRLTSDYKVFHSDSFDEIKAQAKLQEKLNYPFNREMLNLLKAENKFPQEYYYIEKDGDYAFFCLYRNKMNIFTFGKWKCYYPLKVIGYPCSLSNAGYVTNNEKMMLDYVKTMKGAKLILNVTNPIAGKDFMVGETLPTCMFQNRFHSGMEYLNSLRSSYRRRIKRAIEHSKDIEIREMKEMKDSKDSEENPIDLHALYLNTYKKSDYKLEKLEKGFFQKVDATKIVFLKNKKPVSFVLLKQVEGHLDFMLCGMDYQYDTTHLYYFMLYTIIEYAIKHHCKSIDFGQTSEETKMKFGACLEKRYFYAHHSNKVFNCLVRLCKDILEYKYQFPQYRVFREETK